MILFPSSSFHHCHFYKFMLQYNREWFDILALDYAGYPGKLALDVLLLPMVPSAI